MWMIFFSMSFSNEFFKSFLNEFFKWVLIGFQWVFPIISCIVSGYQLIDGLIEQRYLTIISGIELMSINDKL